MGVEGARIIAQQCSKYHQTEISGIPLLKIDIFTSNHECDGPKKWTCKIRQVSFIPSMVQLWCFHVLLQILLQWHAASSGTLLR